jgi:hypothetical protein
MIIFKKAIFPHTCYTESKREVYVVFIYLLMDEWMNELRFLVFNEVRDEKSVSIVQFSLFFRCEEPEHNIHIVIRYRLF